MASVVWTCPVCERRVPLRVDECWCGFKRGDAERHAQGEAVKHSPGAARELIGIALVLALGLGLYVQRSGSDRRSAGARPASLAAAQRDPAPADVQPGAGHEQPAPHESASGAPTDAPSPAAPAAPAAVAPAPAGAPPLSPSPPPEASASTADERRASGLQALEQAYARVASHGQQLAGMLSGYEDDCVGMHSGSVVGNCEQIQGSLAREARALLDSLANAEDDARRAWVRPGDLRTLRQRHGVEGVEETARRALAVR